MANVVTIPVSREKFDAILKEHSTNYAALARKLGFGNGSINHGSSRGYFSRSMWVAISNEFNITLEDIAPDPEPEPEPVPEVPEVTVPDPVLDPNDIGSRFSLFNDEELEILNMFKGRVDEVIELLKQQRKVVSEETLAQGFNLGMEMFWSAHKKEIQDLIVKNIKGAVFSGNLEALKKHDEILDERYPYREYICPTDNGRPD